MKANEDFIQKKQTKSRTPELRKKAQAKAVEQKAKVKPVVKKASPKKPAGSKSSKAAPKSNISNQAYSYIYLTEALVSLIFTLAFLFVFGTSLSWVERYAILWNFDQLDWKMLVPVGLAVVSLVLGGNSLRTFFLAYKQGEVRGALLLLWKLRTWLVSVCVGLGLVIFVLPPLIDLLSADKEVSSDDLPTLEYPEYDLSLAYVEGGSFDMGSSSGRDRESPVHQVTLDGFSMSKYEITNKQYCAFLNERGNQDEFGLECIKLDGDYGGTKCRISKESGRFAVDLTFEDHAVIYVS